MSSPPLTQRRPVIADMMASSGKKESETLSADEVPEMFHEPYILSGYRHVDRPWSYYVKSIFTVHNESMNVWTHGLGFFCVLYSVLAFLHNLDKPADDVARCVIFFGSCCMLNLALSAIAHLFHSKSLWYHFAFLFLDYMGVSIFVFGGGIVSMFILCSKAFFELFHRWFLLTNVLLSWGACFACVYSKVRSAHMKNNSNRKSMLLAGMVSQSTLMFLPTLWRFVECTMDPTCKLRQLSHLFIMFTMIIMCGVTFGCHIPESLWPGHFDMIGHGHQWFHVTAVMTMMIQVWAINEDVHLDQRAEALQQPGVGELLGFLALLVIIETVTVFYFLRSVSCGSDDGNFHEVLHEETPGDRVERQDSEVSTPSELVMIPNTMNLAKTTEGMQNEAFEEEKMK